MRIKWKRVLPMVLKKKQMGAVLLFVFLCQGGSSGFAQGAREGSLRQTQANGESLQEKPGDNVQRVHLALGPEVTFVGLSYGLRVEVLYDFAIVPGVHMLRFAPGFLYGPEFIYVPVALGYRLYLFEPESVFRMFLGAGVEYQGRLISDGPSAHQGVLYSELGALLSVGPAAAISLHLGSDWALLGPPGPGLIARLMFQWGL